MKKFLLLIVGSVFFLAVNVQASPFILPADTPIYFQFNNLEQVDQSLDNSIVVPYEDATGTSGNWGVFNISSIQDGAALSDPANSDIAGGTNLWNNDGNGQITGIFYGINLLTGDTATGGSMELYWHDDNPITADILAGNDGGPDAATVDLFTTGELLAKINFSSGIIDGNDEITVKSNSDLTTALGLSGYSDSFGDVDITAGGLWAELMDRNWFYTDEDGDGNRGEAGERHDLRFSTFYNALPAWDGDPDSSIRGLRSNDPGRVYTVIPEPGTFLLIGFGLLGFAGVTRRKS